MTARWDVGAFAFFLGLVWGSCVLLMGLVAMVNGRVRRMVDLCARIYVGFEPTPVGSLKGAVWGFVDGWISGAIVAWIVNLFVS